jgi:hypothetical protein
LKAKLGTLGSLVAPWLCLLAPRQLAAMALVGMRK